ncbi:MAG: 30S ribosome-binding factor RbfA [Holosporaceae bacterium]|jgi:ribosome-binding factor A|nr:30S ribosome-binding factor RbfA [Holosporaceae bacterium]
MAIVMQPKKTSRQQRVAEEIKRVLSDFLVRSSVWDNSTPLEISSSVIVEPAMISVSEVVVSSCLKHAKVFFVSISDRASNEDCLSFLEKHSPQLRRHLGANVRLKFTPDLRFYIDNSFEMGRKIDGILAKISEK